MKISQKICFIALLLLSTYAIAVEKPDSQDDKLTEAQQAEVEFFFIEGLKQVNLGNLENATALFTRCLNIDPNSAASMFQLAQIRMGNRDITSASLLLEKAVSIDPENKWYKLMLANIYQQQNQNKKAVVLYEELLKIEPESIEYLYTKAGLLGMAGNHQEAIDAYNEIEKKVGINDQVSVAKQRVYLLMGKKEEALNELNRLVEFYPDESHYYGFLAEFYQEQGKKDLALKNYEKVLEVDPENEFVYFSLASFYQEDGNMVKAFEHIKKAFNSRYIDADSKIQYFIMQQVTNRNKSDWSSAQMEELMEILKEKYPENHTLYTIYAKNLILNNNLAEAREYLRKYVVKEKDDPAVWQQLLSISYELRDFEGLYQDGEEAIESFKEEPVFYVFKATAAIQLDKYEAVIEIMEKGQPFVEDDEMKIQFEIYKAEANYKLNNVEKAFNAFENIISLDPKNYSTMNNYAYYLSLRNENLEKAERLSSQVVRANPNNYTYLDTYAWVLFKQKNYTEAKAYMEKAIKNGGEENGVIVEHYGDILYMLGDKAEAKKLWRKALELGDGSDMLEKKIKKSRYIESKEP